MGKCRCFSCVCRPFFFALSLHTRQTRPTALNHNITIISLYLVSENRPHHRQPNPKQTDCPQRALRQPERRAQEPTRAARLGRIHIPVKEQHAEHHPRDTQQRRDGRILESGDEDRHGGLRHVLEEVCVRALGAVELLGLGLYTQSRVQESARALGDV